MANSYTSLFAHIIFSTHNREPLLKSALRERLFAYMGGIARENKIKAVSSGDKKNIIGTKAFRRNINPSSRNTMSNMTKDMYGDEFNRSYGTLSMHPINPGTEVPG